MVEHVLYLRAGTVFCEAELKPVQVSELQK